jgi:hypothetical protein
MMGWEKHIQRVMDGVVIVAFSTKWRFYFCEIRKIEGYIRSRDE